MPSKPFSFLLKGDCHEFSDITVTTAAKVMKGIEHRSGLHAAIGTCVSLGYTDLTKTMKHEDTGTVGNMTATTWKKHTAAIIILI